MKDAPNIACALFNLRKTTRSVTQLYDEILKPSGLRGTQYSLLRVIAGTSPIAVSKLGATMGMDRTTVTRNVRLLERAGYLRIESGGDRRTRLLRLTARGKSAVEKAHPYWAEAQAAVVDGLGGERWSRLQSELQALSELSRIEIEERTEA